MKKLEFRFYTIITICFITTISINILFHLYIIYILICLFLFFLCVLIIFKKIIDKIKKPMEDLEKGFEMVGDGDMTVRIEMESHQGFSSLADRFNEMVGKLKKMVDELESAHKELKSLVKKRTDEFDKSSAELNKAKKELHTTQRKVNQTEKQKSLTAIVSGFAHEINNPLTGILGHINLIELRNDISPYVKEKLLSIKNQSLRIKDIIDELTQLNPEIQKTKLEIQISNLMEKLIKIIKNKKESERITFKKEFVDEDILVFGNHFSLWQVFEGILENAIEAINDRNIEDGLIQVNLKKSNDHSHAIVEIIDNGGGFKNIDKAFDPFYTTKNRTQKKGFGLSISYNLIQEHKGKIIISNIRDGSKVEVYLPLLNKRNKIPLKKTGE